MFARKCLRYLSDDLLDTEAKSLCKALDVYLRRGDTHHVNEICGSLPQLVADDCEPWRIKERLQVVSLIRFPLNPIDEDDVFYSQRKRVTEIKFTANHSDRVILRQAGRIITEVVADLALPIRGDNDTSRTYGVGNWADFRHGPGITSETSDPVKKRLVVRVARSLGRFREYPPVKYGPLACSPSFEELHAKAVLVPKDHKTLRVISAEPTWTQWVQQGFKAQLERRISSHPLMRGHISFKDQELHRDKIRKDPTLATLDLSDASDTIRVKHLFLLGLPLEVRELLLSLRTKGVTYKGAVLPTIGLYPMGAATCFPFETLLFASLLLAYSEVSGHSIGNWGVFGDDILLKDVAAGGFSNFLNRCGFVVNSRKSFIKGFFKETCGIHLYKGIDVTPVKLKKGYPKGPTDVANISYRSYADRLIGFPKLGAFLLNLTSDRGPVRWNKELFRLEESRLSLCAPRVRDSFGVTYLEALRDGHYEIAAPVITTRRRWLPLQGG